MAVSCCVALIFSSNLITSAKVCGLFLYILAAVVCASQSPLTKMWIVAVSLLKAHSLAAVLVCFGSGISMII